MRRTAIVEFTAWMPPFGKKIHVKLSFDQSTAATEAKDADGFVSASSASLLLE